eukprot:gnl/MRDRNA2_/MRDRNA2_27586_c0_seq2.p1 gnl/MRDRNA2_/MRDRNA2_27586_c0~~gnl/MRDRNA2_/MRDRNA2_27586_c0_seq2.p1  ORF type:complete len:455 (+),score=80.10 gnl/MRDRNA2_/MRDRNA2_27586_c0_seq2:90-1454(+)
METWLATQQCADKIQRFDAKAFGASHPKLAKELRRQLDSPWVAPGTFARPPGGIGVDCFRKAGARASAACSRVLNWLDTQLRTAVVAAEELEEKSLGNYCLEPRPAKQAAARLELMDESKEQEIIGKTSNFAEPDRACITLAPPPPSSDVDHTLGPDLRSWLRASALSAARSAHSQRDLPSRGARLPKMPSQVYSPPPYEATASSTSPEPVMQSEHVSTAQPTAQLVAQVWPPTSVSSKLYCQVAFGWNNAAVLRAHNAIGRLQGPELATLADDRQLILDGIARILKPFRRCPQITLLGGCSPKERRHNELRLLRCKAVEQFLVGLGVPFHSIRKCTSQAQEPVCEIKPVVELVPSMPLALGGDLEQPGLAQVANFLLADREAVLQIEVVGDEILEEANRIAKALKKHWRILPKRVTVACVSCIAPRDHLIMLDNEGTAVPFSFVLTAYSTSIN